LAPPPPLPLLLLLLLPPSALLLLSFTPDITASSATITSKLSAPGCLLRSLTAAS
jgi:hypothetical protein